MKAFYTAGLLTLSLLAQAKSIYISSSGNDKNSGASPASALRTFARLKQLSVQAGDVILLDANSVFNESLELDDRTSGTGLMPTIVTSYGNGRAQIVVAAQNGITANNVSNIRIENLVISAAAGSSVANGVYLYSSNGRVLQNVRLSNLSVSGFRTTVESGNFHPSDKGNGILVDNVGAGAGFDRLVLQQIESFGNDFAGINVRASNGVYNTNIDVRNCVTHDNPGISGSHQHSGNGIVVSQVKDALIENNESYANGTKNQANGGPVGIWAWDASGVTIRNNLSFRNKTASQSDGGGFDLDGGVSDSVMENNISFGNDGAGYLLCTYPGSGPVQNVIVRNNISIGDGMKNGYGALAISGEIIDAVLSGNHIETFAGISGTPAAFMELYSSGSNVVIENNYVNLRRHSTLLNLRGSQTVNYRDNPVTNDVDASDFLRQLGLPDLNSYLTSIGVSLGV